MLSDNHGIEVVSVFAMTDQTRCYDMGGASYDSDRDKVLLRDCPPPFTMFCLIAESNKCYAEAGASDRFTISSEDFDRFNVDVVDDGITISDRDMSEILDHPWRDEKQMTEPILTTHVSESSCPKQISNFDRMRAAISLMDAVSGRTDDMDGPDF